jgi:hypothetical protein
MSARGFWASAFTWAKISPELLRVMETLMPVSRSKAPTMARHHSSCTPQYITSAPCACAAPADRKDRAVMAPASMVAETRSFWCSWIPPVYVNVVLF